MMYDLEHLKQKAHHFLMVKWTIELKSNHKSLKRLLEMNDSYLKELKEYLDITEPPNLKEITPKSCAGCDHMHNVGYCGETDHQCNIHRFSPWGPEYFICDDYEEET